MSTRLVARTLVPAALLVLAGCAPKPEAPPAPVATAARPAPPPAPPPAPARSATAIVAGINGDAVAGTITFKEVPGGGIQIDAHLSGLKPGRHGFHIHEVGDCTGDGTAAGPHFNPAGHQHGGPDSPAPHAGDYGNIVADDMGHAMLDMIARSITLDDPVTGIVGRAVVVHEGEDDLTSQPAGNSGKRIGCGVITMDMPSGAMPPAAMPVEPAAPAGASGQPG
jgi:Cu-Zn family superoxide dismutase